MSADLLPFREAFSVLFFVSIGMLVNLRYLASNIGSVLALTALIVLGKYIITVLLGFLIRRPARTFLVVAAGLSQIGEFSFILGQAGLSLDPFKAAYMFRPGFIEPKVGIRSKTAFYRLLYAIALPVTFLLRLAFPNFILTTEQLGRAMIAVAQGAESKRILESRDILALSRITQLTDKRPL